MLKPRAAISRTIVTPGASEDRVLLEISDGPPQAETQSMEGTIRVTLEVKADAYRIAPVEYVQLVAVENTIKALTAIRDYLKYVTRENGYNTTPPLRSNTT